jgi:hypothetical protein
MSGGVSGVGVVCAPQVDSVPNANKLVWVKTPREWVKTPAKQQVRECPRRERGVSWADSWRCALLFVGWLVDVG